MAVRFVHVRIRFVAWESFVLFVACTRVCVTDYANYACGASHSRCACVRVCVVCACACVRTHMSLA